MNNAGVEGPLTTAAAMDRLAHPTMILKLNVGSYRLDEPKRRRDVALTNPSEARTDNAYAIRAAAEDQAISAARMGAVSFLRGKRTPRKHVVAANAKR